MKPMVCDEQEPEKKKAISTDVWDHRSHLGDKSFRTLMCEVESIINLKLLTTISSDVK